MTYEEESFKSWQRAYRRQRLKSALALLATGLLPFVLVWLLWWLL